MSVYYLLTIPKNSLYFVLFTLSYSVCIMYGTTVQLLIIQLFYERYFLVTVTMSTMYCTVHYYLVPTHSYSVFIIYVAIQYTIYIHTYSQNKCLLLSTVPTFYILHTYCIHSLLCIGQFKLFYVRVH